MCECENIELQGSGPKKQEHNMHHSRLLPAVSLNTLICSSMSSISCRQIHPQSARKVADILTKYISDFIGHFMHHLSRILEPSCHHDCGHGDMTIQVVLLHRLFFSRWPAYLHLSLPLLVQIPQAFLSTNIKIAL
jgi:hypothetical protein